MRRHRVEEDRQLVFGALELHLDAVGALTEIADALRLLCRVRDLGNELFCGFLVEYRKTYFEHNFPPWRKSAVIFFIIPQTFGARNDITFY